MKESVLDNVKMYVVGVIGFVNMTLVSLFGDFLPFLWVVLGMMVFDLVSRIYAAAVRKDESVKSKKVWEGIHNKLGMVMLIALCLFIDCGLKMVLELLGIQVVTIIATTAFCMAWIFVREAISIAENLNHGGVKVPAFIIKALTSAKDKIDNAGDSLTGGDK